MVSDQEQRDAREREPVVAEGEWVRGEWHSASCRCRDCDPDAENDRRRDLGMVRFGGGWI